MQKMSKTLKSSEKPLDYSRRSPALPQSIGSYYGLNPTWSFKKCDFDHPQWGLSQNPKHLPQLLKKLASFELQTYGEIFSSTSGRASNTRNHWIDVEHIVKDAQDRLAAQNLNDEDSLCSLALSSLERVWGVIKAGVFYIIWYDLNHEVCPSNKRHT
jgi:hypothetical protein